MNKKLKKIPVFRSEKEEREFWQKADSTEYIDYAKAERVSFPNLKLTSRPVTIRLPVSLIDKAKRRAHQRDIPYQSLLKDILFKAFA
ncbi:BrnA antitoxin family protein [Patescibacteria group bacterium]|nr:BrnA antitoxin family protein [Patescibacteria group bacterium]MBU1472917.1 BrnA antitoxin family protein [Patescibacteria group bacterium]MBU2460327.1 BrnA antitoxin family protein [Patescibacteria group bacterium]MBU2544060.1 BrnA antitoxin family protein [Patescibacteria group bacterium]